MRSNGFGHSTYNERQPVPVRREPRTPVRQPSATDKNIENYLVDVVEQVPKPLRITSSELPLKLPLCKTWGDMACCCCLTLFLLGGGIGIGVWYIMQA